MILKDKVVTITSPKITTDEVTYSVPKVYLGTYSIIDYGSHPDDFKAFDSKGTYFQYKTDDNTWILNKIIG
jgi:predicted metalloprotease with PDZ domain